ncbi:MAG TPA: glycosyltransferase family 4 protein [Pyrinomonadaceae bacterium]|nr:glycosyltransferase family 4 protein [Pyrinomonadaceae bacterium]
MKPTIKILCVIEATTVTGPAKNLLNFCRLMQSPDFCDRGVAAVEVSIVTFDRAGANGNVSDDQATPNAFVTAAREAGVTVDVIPERFRFDTKVVEKLREIVRLRTPDIIQTHMIKSHFLIKLAGLGKKYPWIAYHHGYTTTDLRMRAYNQINRWSLPSAACVITVCEEFARQLVHSGVERKRVVVNHNSVISPRLVNRAEQKALREKFVIADDERVLLSVGRLSREKGHRDLIEALTIVRKLDSELSFKLLIVGEGPEQQALQRAVGERELNHSVIFAGPVSDVAPYYAIADALALPSHSEGSPNVLLEAMAAGVPVVATCVGGVPEIATSGENALLIPPRDPGAMAQALYQVLTNADLAETLSSTAKVHVTDHFSPARYAQSLIRVYRELVSEPRALEKSSYTQRSHIDPVTVPTCRDSQTSA